MNCFENLFHWITNLGLATILTVSVLFFIVIKKYDRLLILIVSLLITAESCFLMKLIFRAERPYLEWGIDSPINLVDYSFPSMHTALAFAVVPFAFYQKNRLKTAFLISVAFLIGYSRIYLGAHRLSEVIAGGLIGFIVSYAIINFDIKNSFCEKLFKHLKNTLELRRQILHLLMGLVLAFLVFYEILKTPQMIAITMFGVILSLVVRKYRVPIISYMINYFERPKDREILPGKGVILLFMSSTLILIIFPLKIVFAAILITAIGDAVSPVAGTYLGRIKLPWNKKKHVEGLTFSIIFTTLAIWTVIPFYPAFIACTITMLAESLALKILGKNIDDNIIVPLIAASSLYILVPLINTI